ncbi:MAG: Rrf2 family transcriptional regulator [Eggerthellaceae bacterium]
MLISTKGRYAMRLMIDLAQGDNKMSLREIAEYEGISQKYLEQLVRPLTQAGLLVGMRGKNGGYQLAKDKAAISAGDILRAVEGTTIPVACSALETGCERGSECNAVRFWAGLDHVIEDYVDGATLADLVHN